MYSIYISTSSSPPSLTPPPDAPSTPPLFAPSTALFFTSDQGTRSKLIQGLENVFKNHLDAFVQHLDVLEVVMCF